MATATEKKNAKLPKPGKEKDPEPPEETKAEESETPSIQTKPKNTGVIEIKDDPDKGKIRIFRFKLLVASCKKNTSFKKGVVDIKQVEHVHWYRTHDARTGNKHIRATLTCGHSHPISIEYIKDKAGKVTGIDMDKCVIGPAIREVTIGAENSKKKVKRWLAVLLGKKSWISKEDFKEKSQDIYDDHKHILDYIDFEDIIVQPGRAR